jgi:small redox-active disulfide protein 2
MKVQILGPGCSKCKTLEQRVRQLVEKHQLPVEVEKVTDIQEMIKYGIMMTPGLIIDGVVKSVGSIPKDAQLLEWMKGSQV